MALFEVGSGGGAAVGGVVGAVRTESADAKQQKIALLTSAMDDRAFQDSLRRHFQQQVRTRLALDLPMIDSGAMVGPDGRSNPGLPLSTWRIEISVTNVMTSSSIQDQAFGIQMFGTLALRPLGDNRRPDYEKPYFVASETTLTTAEWAAQDGAALHNTLDRMARQMAEKMLADLLDK
jgi:hypothetical protein